MSHPISLHPATTRDLPVLTTILITAFAPGPWSTLLFPASLRTSIHDEAHWRLGVTAAQLGRAGHTHVVATTKEEGGEASEQGEGEERVLGWAHWIDVAAAAAAPAAAAAGAGGNDDAHETTSNKLMPDPPPSPPGLDTAALAQLRGQGAAVEQQARTALGEESWANSLELQYLVVDPQHQRKGVGRLLTQTLLDRAAAEGKAVWLRSTLEGQALYLALGFEEVGEGRVFGERQFAMVKRAGCE